MTAQSSPDKQPLLTTLAQATAELAQLNKQYGQKLGMVEAKVDDLIVKLTKLMTAFRLNFNDIKEATHQQAETAKAQAETAKAPAKNVSQLIAQLGKMRLLR